MTDRAAAVLLGLLLALAAVLASAAPWLTNWAWHVRFGCQAIGIVTLVAPLWLFWQNDRRNAPREESPLARFLSVANHEMKTPLTGIKAYVELLADGDAEDEATREEFLSGISSQAERLERTIDELIELVRDRAVTEPRQGQLACISRGDDDER
jgi:signal transduction histidine kinase